MDFKLGETSGSGDVVGDIVTDLIGKPEKEYIVKLRDVDVGNFFEGLVYVRQSHLRQNRQNKEKYDLRLLCLDGDGEIFEMTVFEIDDKIEVNNKVVLVKEGQKVSAHGRIFYNATSITMQQTQYVPTTAFLKYVDNVSEYKECFKEVIEEMKNNPKYAVVFNKMEENLSITTKMYDSPYPHKYGGRLGDFLKVFIDTIELYRNWGTRLDKKKEEDMEFFILLALSTMVQPLMREYARFNDTEFFIKEKDKLPLALEPYMVQILYTSGINEEELSIITNSITSYEQYRKSGEIPITTEYQMSFYYCLKMIDSKLFIENM